MDKYKECPINEAVHNLSAATGSSPLRKVQFKDTLAAYKGICRVRLPLTYF